MERYLLVATHDIWEKGETSAFLQLGEDLTGQGHEVDLYLIQSAVMLARESPESLIPRLHGKQLKIWADDFSLDARGLEHSELFSCVHIGNADKFVSLMLEVERVIWHS